MAITLKPACAISACALLLCVTAAAQNHFTIDTQLTGENYVEKKLTYQITVKERRTTSQGDTSARLSYPPGDAPAQWAIPLAESIMARYPDYRTAYYKDYTYVHGYAFEAFDRLYDATGDGRFLDYIRDYIDHFVDRDGHYRGGALTNLDNFMTGSAFCTLYRRTGDEKYRTAATQILSAVEGYPSCDGQFWHGNKSPAMWIDGVFMMQMFLIRYAQHIGRSEYCYDIACRNVLAAAKHLQRPDGLLLHAWTTTPDKVAWADPDTGLSPESWSEGMGWYVLVTAELLAVLPRSHKDYGAIADIYRRMALGLKQTQDPRTGGWFMVVDKGDNPVNFIDPSGTAMFVYAIRRGVELGLLPGKQYLPVAQDGYRCLYPFIVVNDHGLLDVVGGCDGVPVKKDFLSYVTIPKMTNAKETVVGMLWAAVIMELSADGTAGTR